MDPRAASATENRPDARVEIDDVVARGRREHPADERAGEKPVALKERCRLPRPDDEIADGRATAEQRSGRVGHRRGARERDEPVAGQGREARDARDEIDPPRQIVEPRGGMRRQVKDALGRRDILGDGQRFALGAA